MRGRHPGRRHVGASWAGQLSRFPPPRGRCSRLGSACAARAREPWRCCISDSPDQCAPLLAAKPTVVRAVSHRRTGLACTRCSARARGPALRAPPPSNPAALPASHGPSVAVCALDDRFASAAARCQLLLLAERPLRQTCRCRPSQCGTNEFTLHRAPPARGTRGKPRARKRFVFPRAHEYHGIKRSAALSSSMEYPCLLVALPFASR